MAEPEKNEHSEEQFDDLSLEELLRGAREEIARVDAMMGNPADEPVQEPDAADALDAAGEGPMLYVGEQAVTRFAAREQLPVVHNTCPADKHTKRQEVKELIAALQAQYPDLKTKIFGAMQRLPLPQWGILDEKKPE